MKDIHWGELVRKKVEDSGYSVSELARSIHCSRSNVYSLYKRRSIDIEQLLKISKVLKYNFIAAYLDGDIDIQETYVIVVEVDGTKLEDFITDDAVKVIKGWKVADTKL